MDTSLSVLFFFGMTFSPQVNSLGFEVYLFFSGLLVVHGTLFVICYLASLLCLELLPTFFFVGFLGFSLGFSFRGIL